MRKARQSRALTPRRPPRASRSFMPAPGPRAEKFSRTAGACSTCARSARAWKTPGAAPMRRSKRSAGGRCSGHRRRGLKEGNARRCRGTICGRLIQVPQRKCQGCKTATCYGILTVMNAKLKELIERVETWPEETQEEVIEILLSIEQARLTDYELTDADRAALARSAEDVREGRFAPDERMSKFFERNRCP